LAQRVEQIEKLIRSGANVAGKSLASLLETAQAQLDSERVEEQHATIGKKEREQQERAAVAHMVEREHRLNAAEKEQYGRFLEQDYFTKANFDELDRFYAHSWDKLSDEGKAEMSHRVWEGIRRDEYEFDELPENVRKKESERLYQQFDGQTKADDSLKNIPEQDKQDFINEYKAGNDKGISKVLKREVFAENVSSRTDSAKEAESVAKENKPERQEPKKDNEVNKEQNVELEGVTFAEAKSMPPTQLPQPAAGRSAEKG
jgi:hypothetical protein